jgi:predicted thioesterase
MNLLSQLIMHTCMFYDSQTCVQDLHYCVRDNFQVEWFEELTKNEELLTPLMIQFCEKAIEE